MYQTSIFFSFFPEWNFFKTPVVGFYVALFFCVHYFEHRALFGFGFGNGIGVVWVVWFVNLFFL
jgi:hypothetical protein